MLDALMLVAACAALMGAFTRNLTAVALLVSYLASTALCKLGAPFEPLLWLAIDVVAASIIIRPEMKGADWLIAASFVPAAILYFWQPDHWGTAVNVIVVAQMLLTFPAAQANAFASGALAYIAERRNNILDFVAAGAVYGR